MAFLGDAVIDEVLTFYANTHDPTTEGNPAADADAPPTYRVYEEETGTPLLTGSMAKLDDSNTLGFYSEAITLSAANGFEVDKTYCIRKAATVNSVDGVEIDTFKMVVDVAVDGSNRVLAAVDDVTNDGDTALLASGLATAAALATASGHAESAANAATAADGKLDVIDPLVDDIKAKTDNLPSDPADQSLIIAATDAITGLIGTPAVDLAADIAAVKAVVDAADVYKKNVAVTAFAFYMELTDGDPGTGLTVTATVSKDGGAFAGLAGSVTEISAGWYEVDIAQGEMNADEVALKFTATGAKQRNIKIRTQG